jgi:dUTP pyrophosphatase
VKINRDVYPDGIKPAHIGDAACDLRACITEPITISQNQTVEIPLGVWIDFIASDVCALLLPRSGLSIRDGIGPANFAGLIDPRYKGELVMGAWNRLPTPYTVKPGERVCQILLLNFLQGIWSYVDEVESTSSRGEGGLGSTGKH